VEVDGYLAGKKPVKVKLKAGAYGFRVVKPGFQP
jgi:hypothetical protein